MHKDQMRDILLSDLARWQEREAAQEVKDSRASLGSYAEDQKALHGIGLVTSREVRYSERWSPSKPALRGKGGGDSRVIVHNPTHGIKPYVISQASARRGSTASKRRQATQATHRIMAADLAPIGNVE